ncbi:TIGR00268 family protein, partial [Candidatus Bathyarchaeota archaeon]
AKYLKLPVYSKPSNTCLATRFPYGYRLSLEKLKRVDKAESYIKANLGLKIVRVRDHDNLARIEIGKEDYKTLLKNKKLLEKTVEKIKNLGFRFVTLDLEGYRSGSFDYNFTKN